MGKEKEKDLVEENNLLRLQLANAQMSNKLNELQGVINAGFTAIVKSEEFIDFLDKLEKMIGKANEANDDLIVLNMSRTGNLTMQSAKAPEEPNEQ